MSARFASMLALVVSAAAVIASAPVTSSASRTVVRDATCVTTPPNGHAPGIVADRAVWARHGNGILAAVLRRDGTLVTNPQGGYKMLWFARNCVAGHLRVKYQRIDQPSSTILARARYFDGYNVQPNATMSQMSFEAGCWRITGTLRNKPLTFVVRVVIGSG
jgi:hypothetical protein